jgi:hypothetical protein
MTIIFWKSYRGENRVEKLMDLRGDQENPRRIGASELQKLPRAEVWTTDPLCSGKEIVYSGTPFAEVLKAGGLPLDSGMGVSVKL